MSKGKFKLILLILLFDLSTSITVIDIGQKVMSNEYGLMVIKKDNEK